MPRGVFNFSQQPGRAAGTNRINPGVAAYAGAGYKAFGDSMRVLSRAVGEVAIERHQTQKRTQINADNAAFKTYLETEYAKANAEALKTSDPKQVSKIYDGYYGRVESYISGKSPEGVPNVRWDDHESMLREHLGSFRMQADAARDQRIMEIDDAASMARLQQSKNLAVKRGDYSSVRAAVEDAGSLTGKTADEIKLDVQAALRQTDLSIIDNLASKISQMDDPAAAAEIVEDFETDVKGDRFEHLSDDDRKKALHNLRAESAAVGRRVDAQEAATVRENNEAYLDWQLANPEEKITLAKVQEEGLPKEFQVRVMRAEQKAKAENRKAGDEVHAAAALLPMVMSYNPADDPKRETAQALYQRIHSLPGELSGFLGKIFNEQYQAAKGTPGAKSKAYVLSDIAGELLSDPKKGTAADFKKGLGKGWTDEEAVKQVALEQDRFLRWVEQTQPTDEEMLNYTQTNERWKALKETQKLETFRRGAPESLRLNFSPASLNDAQGSYLDDKSSLTGLLD